MKKITLLFSFLMAFTASIYGQTTCTQAFTASGTDASGATLTINASALNCFGAAMPTNLKLVNPADDLTSGFCSTDGSSWFGFDLSIDGGTPVTMCGDDFDDIDITGFTTLTITAHDDDDWEDSVDMTISVQATFMPVGVPSCSAIISPANGATSVMSSMISWSAAQGGATGYFVNVGTTAGGTDVMNMVDAGNVLTYNLGSLASGTTYYVTVIPYNTFGNATGCNSSSFTTCGAVSTFPWTENFESLATVGTDAFPGCWMKQNGDWSTSSATTYNNPKSGTKYLRVAWNATNEYMWTVGFELTAGTSYDFSTFVQGDNGTAWVADMFVNTVQNSNGATALGGSYAVPGAGAPYGPQTYFEMRRTFVPNTSGTYYFAVRVNEPTGNPWYLAFDDFKVEITPLCAAPTAGTATAPTSTTAVLNWTATAGNFEVAIQPAGTGMPAAADGTGIDVSATTYNASNLSATTAYEFYVRRECGAGVFSSWSGPYAFNTTQVPGCASNPVPVNGATAVPAGAITLTWDVPTTGDVPTSYDLYTGTTAANVTTLIGNYPTNTTGNARTVNAYNTVIYWRVVPKNSAGSATGCDVWSFTTGPSPGYCLIGNQYPTGAAYTPMTCDGITPNEITTGGWAGEYSLVNVVAGETYKFLSSNANDFITIGDTAGANMLAAGVTPVTWVSNITGSVRFYNHTNDQCGTANVNRTRSVICGVVATDTPDWANLQHPATITISQGGSETVYGQIYEGGLTDVAPNIDGMSPGILAWVGISPVGANTNPSTWTNWVAATHNGNSIGNNEEYMATIGATLAPGTYYYATRYRLNGGPYVYGGYNGGFWNGTDNISGILTVTPPPAPGNDLCAGAITLTPGGTFAQNAISATVVGATTATGLTYACQTGRLQDVWFTVTVPASGNITIQTALATGSPLTDTVLSVFSGTCGTLTEIGCDDDDTTNNFSTVSLTGQTPGAVLYVGVWKYTTAQDGPFQISAFDASLSTDSFDAAAFKFYPNPVKDVLNLSYDKEITNVSVFNLLGQQVSTTSVGATTASIDMSGLASGGYVVKVTAGDQVKTIKVIKE